MGSAAADCDIVKMKFLKDSVEYTPLHFGHVYYPGFNKIWVDRYEDKGWEDLKVKF